MLLKYKRGKERYIILLQPELGDAPTKSLVLAVGTAVIVSGLAGACACGGTAEAATAELSGGCAGCPCMSRSVAVMSYSNVRRIVMPMLCCVCIMNAHTN